MKQRSNDIEQHIERHGPNNAAWNETLEERSVHAALLRQMAEVMRDMNDQYAGMVWAHGLEKWERNGIHGVQHAKGIGRLYHKLENSMVNLAERLEE